MKHACSPHCFRFAALLIALVTGGSLLAQSPAPAVNAARALQPADPLELNAGRFDAPPDKKRTGKVRSAFFRLVDPLPAEAGAFDLELRLAGKEPQLLPLAAGQTTGLYQQIPAGSIECKFIRHGDPRSVFGVLRANLSAGTYVTLWIREKNGRAVLELTGDGYDRTVVDCVLLIRNFVPGVTASITSMSPDSFTAPTATNTLRAISMPALAPGDSVGFEKVPPKFNVWIEATLPSRKVYRTAVPVNFDRTRRLSLLLRTDSYGEMTTELVTGGPTMDAEQLFEAPAEGETTPTASPSPGASASPSPSPR